MEYETFNKTLKEYGLNLKQFSELSGSKYSTCSKWGKDGRPVSDWVESWLKLYIKSKDMDKIIEAVVPHIKKLNE
ncbi:MAG: XRE family transcriptional regulator [Campylobacteraceae bacterium]|nr:XRE family transcriptional regulator [Campylobacteraceae bacterium]